MRHILAVLLLALCLCGCAYAEENPFQKATEGISSQIDTEKAGYAAAALQKFYESGEATADLLTIDDGLGGVLVFDGAADGVYSLDCNAETYDRLIRESTDTDVIFLNLAVGLMLILFVYYLCSVLKRLFSSFKDAKPQKRVLAASVGLVILTMSLFVVVLGKDCIAIASDSTTDPGIVREFLRVSVAGGRGKFYSRSEVKDLLQEYAAKYKAAEA